MIKIKYTPVEEEYFLSVCIEQDTRTKIAEHFDCAPNTVTRIFKKHYPEVLNFPAKMSIGSRVLHLKNLKRCSMCKEVKDVSEFHKDAHTTTGLVGKCKSCRKVVSAEHYQNNKEKYYANRAKYRAYLLNRTPKWANLLHIEEFYAGCPEGYEVDHIIPLQGKNVSGLHVENNLQYLTVAENRSKSNKYEIK